MFFGWSYDIGTSRLGAYHNGSHNIAIGLKIGGKKKNQIRNIFLPFEQVEGQSFEKYGGTGLGLTITKGLVNALNGEIK